MRHDRSKFPFQCLLLDLQAGQASWRCAAVTSMACVGWVTEIMRSSHPVPPATSRHSYVQLGPDAEMGTPPT